MKKYLSFIAIILGVFANLLYSSSDFNALMVSLSPMFETLIPVFIIEAIGVILAILALTIFKEGNNKIVTIVGLVLNLIPVIAYFPNFLLT